MATSRITPFSKWRNRKHGNYYIAEAVITDFTNIRNGTSMVLYHSVSDVKIRGVRELSEFCNKFDKVEE